MTTTNLASTEDNTLWYPNNGNTFTASNGTVYLGAGNGEGASTACSFRFAVTGLTSSANITSAYLTTQLYRGTALSVRIVADKTPASAQITSASDFSARLSNSTLATVTWSTGSGSDWETYNSPSLVTLLNELKTLNPSYINLLLRDDNSLTDGVLDIRLFNNGTVIPSLTYTYSTGAASYTKTVAMDSLLRLNDNKIVTLNSLILARDSKSVSVDSRFRGFDSKTLTADSLFRASDTKTAAFTILLEALGVFKTEILDVLIRQPFATTSVDLIALLMNLENMFLPLDALIEGSLLVFAVLDAFVMAAVSKPAAIDVLLGIATNFGPAFLDTLIRTGDVDRVSLDAILGSVPFPVRGQVYHRDFLVCSVLVSNRLVNSCEVSDE